VQNGIRHRILQRPPRRSSEWIDLFCMQFAEAPHFNHLAAVRNAFDFSGPRDFVRHAAMRSDRVR